MNDPPGYLTRILGILPIESAGIDRWIQAATVIETYRLEHGNPLTGQACSGRGHWIRQRSCCGGRSCGKSRR